jgi:hypothetical protein
MVMKGWGGATSCSGKDGEGPNEMTCLDLKHYVKCCNPIIAIKPQSCLESDEWRFDELILLQKKDNNLLRK